jgi:hypothetical protein
MYVSRLSRVGLLMLSMGSCESAPSSDLGDEGPGTSDAAAVAALWRLADAPEFSVSESSAPAPVFQIFRASSGLITEDGQLVVANTGSGNLIYLDQTGSVLRVVGNEGEGPGEFLALRDLFLAADGQRIWAWDSRRWRASLFSGSGEYQTAISLAATRMEVPRGFIADGRVISTELRASPMSVGDPRRYRLRDADGELVREILGPPEPPARSIVFDAAEVQAGRLGSMRISVSAGCIGGVEEVVVGSELFTVDTGAGVVRAFDEVGKAREVYRAHTRTPITEPVRAALRTWIMGVRIPPPGDTLENFFHRMGEVGDPLPAWQGVMPDPSGRLWLELPRCHTTGPASFQIIDSQGRDIATIDVAANLRLLAVRDDRVLVGRSDEVGLEYIELYRILHR